MMNLASIYEGIGGESTIKRIVDTFYPKVYSNEEISPLFEGDIQDIKRKQMMFLSQFTGGPPLYSQEFGPPNMRNRHAVFDITPRRAEIWLMLMRETFDEVGLTGTEAGEAFYDRLTQVAPLMITRFEGGKDHE